MAIFAFLAGGGVGNKERDGRRQGATADSEKDKADHCLAQRVFHRLTATWRLGSDSFLDTLHATETSPNKHTTNISTVTLPKAWDHKPNLLAQPLQCCT